MSLGEGAGFLVLETAASAVARGCAPVAELAGWAVGAEAHHVTNPAPDGEIVSALVKKAVARAGVSPKEIDYVNAHGTGTQLNDQVEAAALTRALGDETRRIPVSSSKGQIGHTLGAAGAIEAVITALVVARRTLVPTAGLEDPDPSIELLHVRGVGRQVPTIRAAISNAFGFGGMDTVLVFRHPEFRPEGVIASVAPCNSLQSDAALDQRNDPALEMHFEAAPEESSRLDPRIAASVASPALRARPVIAGVALVGDFGRLGVKECALLSDALTSGGGPVGADRDFDADRLLDEARSRRLDRAARLATVAAEHALSEAGATRAGTGLAVGSAFGSIDACAAFMHRVLEKGARSASPADFPNLVPSSAAGHVSIYAQLCGPTFATADLATSGESAFAQATELVEVGESKRMVAATVETGSHILSWVSDLFAHAASQTGASRIDLAAALVVEQRTAVERRGGRALAEVAQILQWREDPRAALVALRGPSSELAEVILARADDGADALLEKGSWCRFPRLVCAPVLGESDALGGATLAIAAARIGTGRARETLVLGLARSRGYAIVLATP